MYVCLQDRVVVSWSYHPRPSLISSVVCAAVPCVLCWLPQVLDSEDADALLGVLTLQVQAWSPTQLAAAVTASLPCLGEVAPTEGQQLAVLFAATGAAAGGLSPSEAAQVLMVVAQLPGYAPDAQVGTTLCRGGVGGTEVARGTGRCWKCCKLVGSLLSPTYAASFCRFGAGRQWCHVGQQHSSLQVLCVTS